MRLLILMGLLLFACGCPSNGPTPAPPPEPEPPSPVTALAEEMRGFVVDLEPVSDAKLAEFYHDFAEVLQRDNSVVRNTTDVREAHTRALKLAFGGTEVQTSNPGLGVKLDKAAADAIGLQNRALTPELRARAVAIYEAISVAVQ